MQHLQTDIVQSFWLRFWREPHQGQHREWRGTIWHEQQAVHEKPTAVASPDEAFEFVRQALRVSSESPPTPQAVLASAEPRIGLIARMMKRWRRKPESEP